MTAAHTPLRRIAAHPRERLRGRLDAGHPLSAPRIAALAVANGERAFTQEQVLDRLGLRGDEFAEGIFARCGVQRRHLDLSDEFLALNLQGRTERVGAELLARAVEAVDRLDVDPDSIGAVFTSSLHSLDCPSLAHRLLEHYDMDRATDKYHLSAVGCASAVPLMRLASQALRDRPERGVLVVAAESMSSILMPAGERDTRAKTVGSAIFGDGCAAALLSYGEDCSGPAILASKVHQIPGTLGAVNLVADPLDSHLHLDRELPDLAAADLQELVAAFLGDSGLGQDAIDHWIVHPGGRRIIESARDALSLNDDDVEASWRALAEHGNVGTPSIFYVIDRTIAERRPRQGEHGLAITIGPGVSVGLMLLRW